MPEGMEQQLEVRPRAPGVGVLGWRSRVVWPNAGFSDFVLVFGTVFFPILLGRFLGRANSGLYWVGIGIGALGVVIALAWLVRWIRRDLRERPYTGPLPMTDAERVSLQFPTPALESAALSGQDDPFEPAIVRTLVEPAFGEVDATGGPRLWRRADSPTFKPGAKDVPRASRHTSQGRWLADVLCVVIAVGAVVVMQRVATDSWWKGIRADAIWTGIALAGCLAAFAKPTYVRLSPGALDVVLYPVLGAGRPLIERYDLRTARVVIDAKAGWVGVFDPARPARQALYLRTRWVLTREDLHAWVLRAARTKHPTPLLPMDDLIG